MPQEAKYTYIQWLPENRLVLATQEALLGDKFITGLLGKNIYAYSRDDNATMTLPSLSIDSGEIFSYDNMDRLEINLIINVYFGMDLIRARTTEVVSSTMATIRSRIQNFNFFSAVSLNLFDYNKTLSKYQSELDRQQFNLAIKTRNPLQRYGISYSSKPATATQLNGIDCYKGTSNFTCWIAQQDYYEFLEILGINAQIDPNKVVYNLWENFSPNIQEI